MALALRAWATNRGGKNSVRNLRYGPRTRLVRGMYFTKFTSRLSIKSFFLNFQIIWSKRKIIYIFYVFGGKPERNEESKRKHWKFNIAIQYKVSILKCKYVEKAVLRKHASWLVKNRVCITRWRHRTSARCWRSYGANKENLHFGNQSWQVVFFFLVAVFSKRNGKHVLRFSIEL